MEFIAAELTTKRVAVVTGANNGIGLEIVRQLASNGVLVVLTARNKNRGLDAAEKLKGSGVSDVVFHQLDVADPTSVSSLAEFIKTKFGKLDVLVNNAAVTGVEPDPEILASIQRASSEQGGAAAVFWRAVDAGRHSYEMAEECLNINYYGTKRVTEALIPLLLLSPSPRVVNVSSLAGLLSRFSNENTRNALSDVNGLTEEKLDKLLQSFLNDKRENKEKEKGWPAKITAYSVSKVAINAYTRILAKQYPNFCINCVHPGFVKTDMSMNVAELSVEEGAKCPVMLALLPDGSPSGLFYQKNMEVLPF